MKKIFKRIISATSSVAILASALPILQNTVAKAEDPLVLNLTAGDAYIPYSKVENGDITVHLKLYVEPTVTDTYETAQIKFVPDSDNIVLKNISQQTDMLSTRSEMSYSGGTVLTDYVKPFCFGSITTLRSGEKSYTLNSGSITSNRYAEPVGVNIGSHSYIKSDGEGGAYFTITQKTSASAAKVKQTFSTKDGTLEMVKVNEDTNLPNKSCGVKFRYTYIDQQTYNSKTATVEYNYYNKSAYEGEDSFLYADENLDGLSDCWVWQNPNPTSVLGNKDEFALCEVDAVVKMGTAKGDYTISLDDSYSFICSSSGKNYKLSDGTATSTKAVIHVVDDVTVTDSSINKNFYFTSEDKNIVTTKDVVNYVKANVTTNGTVQNVDISDDITGVNQSVAGQYTSGKYSYFNIPLTYCGYNLKDTSGNVLKTNIYIGQRGDADLDGSVNAKDAVIILKYYANQLTGKETNLQDDSSLENFAFFLADTNEGSKDHGKTGGKLDSKDAVNVLKYYAAKMVNGNTTWSDILG